jgi:transcriptional regulator with XRE-family HTH domain
MAEPVDIAVGQHIRLLRYKQQITQQDLAAKLSISFQQLQKYEKGQNRVSASRLVDIATAMGVHPGYFFGETQELPASEDQQLGQLIGVYNNLSRRKQKILVAMAKEL